MRWLTMSLVCGTLLAASAGSAHAQVYGWDSFWHRFSTDFKRMNHYPEPFIYADRDAARAPFRTMICNGWQLQNTLSGHYFHPETQELTTAGEMKVRAILTNTPEQFRTVYVVRADGEEATSIRVDSVQQTVARLIPRGPLPQVVETTTELYGRPGEYVDSTLRKAYSGAPAPVLPASSGGGSGNN